MRERERERERPTDRVVYRLTETWTQETDRHCLLDSQKERKRKGKKYCGVILVKFFKELFLALYYISYSMKVSVGRSATLS